MRLLLVFTHASNVSIRHSPNFITTASCGGFLSSTKEVVGISDKMLSKELKDLEANQLVNRTVNHTFPPTAEYSVTKHTQTLGNVISALKVWGYVHRKKIIGK